MRPSKAEKVTCFQACFLTLESQKIPLSWPGLDQQCHASMQEISRKSPGNLQKVSSTSLGNLQTMSRKAPVNFWEISLKSEEKASKNQAKHPETYSADENSGSSRQ